MTAAVFFASAFVATNVLNVLKPVEVTNTVTVTRTNVVTRTVDDPAVAATTNLVTRTFKLHHASAADLETRFNNMWTGDFGSLWKIAKVAQSFPEANALMVTAPRAVMNACEAIVRDVDVEPPQVYVEARFVELSNQAFHRLGIDWSMLNGMKGSIAINAGYNERKMEGVSTYDSLTGGYTINAANENGGLNSANLSHVNATIGMSELYVILKALEGSTDARTFSNPKIIVSSGKKATVDMTTKYPNVTVAVKRTINDSTQSIDLDMKMAEIPGRDPLMFAKEAYFSWGISLDVTPRVGTNGLINVQIVPTISSLNTEIEGSGFVQSADSTTMSSKYPVINVQRLLTEFNMASEQTAVIGGLSRTVEEQIDTGIPWLRDWWWIGPRLFGGKERVKTQREIIVFVTVGLVDPRAVRRDEGLPLNAVLGRQYTDGVRREPGERRRVRPEGMDSLDLRSLEEQARDPRRLKRTEEGLLKRFPIPFTKKSPEGVSIDELDVRGAGDATGPREPAGKNPDGNEIAH
ncbi:MAG: hypothetical protein MJ138_06355 [Kiritimatiellae bacterium]|nr:hypothetical protein [Kiritimatiellia bacterium]